MPLATRMREAAAGVSGGPTVIAFDDFNRAAGNLAGTSANTGQVWAANTGGISTLDGSGHAVPHANSGNDYNTIDVGVADYTLTFTFSTVATFFPGVAVRYVDFNNHLHFQYQNSTSYVLEKKISGSFTTVQTINVTPANGDVITLTLSGSNVTCLVNGVSQFSGSVSGISTSSTKCGLGGATTNNGATIDNFTVTV